jgi:hypothetical protein
MDITPSHLVLSKAMQAFEGEVASKYEKVNSMLEEYKRKFPPTYKNIDFVANECRKLAEQIAIDKILGV